MSLKLIVGFNQKLGQPDYGSVGASCSIECELDGDLLFRDPGGFQKQVQGVYAACTQAVHDELARHQQGHPNNGQRGPEPNGNGQPANGAGNAAGNGHAHGNGSGYDQANGNGAQNGRGARSGGRLATVSQARAIYAIANRNGLDLPALLRSRFGCDRPDDLTLSDASSLIDELKRGAPANGTGGSR